MPGPNDKNNVLKYTALATELLAALGLGIWGGISIDRRLGSSPAFTVIFPLLGLFFSFYKLIRSLNKDAKK